MNKIAAKMLGAGLMFGLLGDFFKINILVALGTLLAVPGAMLLALCHMGQK